MASLKDLLSGEIVKTILRVCSEASLDTRTFSISGQVDVQLDNQVTWNVKLDSCCDERGAACGTAATLAHLDAPTQTKCTSMEEETIRELHVVVEPTSSARECREFNELQVDLPEPDESLQEAYLLSQRCPYCLPHERSSKPMTSGTHLARHILKEHHPCQWCTSVFRSAERLHNHLCHPHACPVTKCNVSASSVTTLQQHIELAHSSAAGGLRCSVCSWCFFRTTHLLTHLFARHGLNFIAQCAQCEAEVIASNWGEHISGPCGTSNKELTFVVCGICRRPLLFNSYYMMSHLVECGLQCSHCNIVSVTRHKAVSHERFVHGNSEDACVVVNKGENTTMTVEFECAHCGKNFTTAELLKKHSLMHKKQENALVKSKKMVVLGSTAKAEPNRFRCKQCHKCFTERYLLEGHLCHAPINGTIERSNYPETNVDVDDGRYHCHYKSCTRSYKYPHDLKKHIIVCAMRRKSAKRVSAPPKLAVPTANVTSPKSLSNMDEDSIDSSSRKSYRKRKLLVK